MIWQHCRLSTGAVEVEIVLTQLGEGFIEMLDRRFLLLYGCFVKTAPLTVDMTSD